MRPLPRALCFRAAQALAKFQAMLSPSNLQSASKWLLKCRMWRLILLQQEAGYWDPLPSVAFALQANHHVPEKMPRPYAFCAPLKLLEARRPPPAAHAPR